MCARSGVLLAEVGASAASVSLMLRAGLRAGLQHAVTAALWLYCDWYCFVIES